LLRVFLRLVADTIVVGLVLFGAAGTFAWQRAWLLLGVLLGVRVASALVVHRVNPTLLRERATVLVHSGQPWSDRLLLFASMTSSFIALPAVAALDVFRWHLLAAPPRMIAIAGLALFSLGWIVIALALHANAFAVTVVRLQGERGHSVADTGIYRFIRHPMYAASPLVNVGLALWLGSYAAALFAIVPLALLVARIALEERVLRRELPGYGEYAMRVPYRLLPGVW
jgi:protein-S-isoprenylcysteine O-methyltransferase Ste14